MTQEQLRKKVDAAAHAVRLNAHPLDRIVGRVVRQLWAQMHDAPWKSDHEDRRFRPRIIGRPTHIKAFRADAEWPDEQADWETIIAEEVDGLSRMAVPNLGPAGK
jgi:hypothetical protein